MANWPDELRLAWVVLLGALLLWSSVRFARRISQNDWIQTLLDATLIIYAIQYASIGGLGLIGILNVWTIAAVTVVLCGLLWWFARDSDSTTQRIQGGRVIVWIPLAGGIFVVVYVSCLLWEQRFAPPLANDALTYHLPAAVRWLHEGRVSLFPTWYFNPANTYSPLAGSAFMLWLLAPLENDVLARFAQAPALLMIYLGMIQLARSLGGTTTIATLVALAAVTSRAFISQTILAKDDLFVAAFFIAAVAGFARQDKLAPWRIGIAAGLLFATKYTALMSLPLLLLVPDAPRRRLPTWTIVLLCTLVLAGPWFIRNILISRNPLFPITVKFGPWTILDGLFATRGSDELASAAGLWRTLVDGYYSPTLPVVLVLVLGWIAAAGASYRRLHEPLVRLCLLGPPVGILLFIVLSPYPEIRFVYPSLLLMFASIVLAIRAFTYRFAIATSVLVALIALLTGFVLPTLQRALPTALIVTSIALMVILCLSRSSRLALIRASTLGGTVLVAGIGVLVYIYWTAFLYGPTGYAAHCVPVWSKIYGSDLAAAWEFVRSETPSRATIAYVNTHYTYPLQGFELSRRVVYAPPRAGVAQLHHLPRSTRKLSGEQIANAVTAAMNADADARFWMNNLTRRGARYVFIVKSVATGDPPPELGFVRSRPEQFEALMNNSAAAVFRIIRPSDNEDSR